MGLSNTGVSIKIQIKEDRVKRHNLAQISPNGTVNAYFDCFGEIFQTNQVILQRSTMGTVGYFVFVNSLPRFLEDVVMV